MSTHHLHGACAVCAACVQPSMLACRLHAYLCMAVVRAWCVCVCTCVCVRVRVCVRTFRAASPVWVTCWQCCCVRAGAQGTAGRATASALLPSYLQVCTLWYCCSLFAARTPQQQARLALPLGNHCCCAAHGAVRLLLPHEGQVDAVQSQGRVAGAKEGAQVCTVCKKGQQASPAPAPARGKTCSQDGEGEVKSVRGRTGTHRCVRLQQKRPTTSVDEEVQSRGRGSRSNEYAPLPYGCALCRTGMRRRSAQLLRGSKPRAYWRRCSCPGVKRASWPRWRRP